MQLLDHYTELDANPLRQPILTETSKFISYQTRLGTYNFDKVKATIEYIDTNNNILVEKSLFTIINKTQTSYSIVNQTLYNFTVIFFYDNGNELTVNINFDDTNPAKITLKQLYNENIGYFLVPLKVEHIKKSDTENIDLKVAPEDVSLLNTTILEIIDSPVLSNITTDLTFIAPVPFKVMVTKKSNLGKSVFINFGTYQFIDPVLFESYSTGDDANGLLYATYWIAQTFTATSNHTVSALNLKIYKAGTPVGSTTFGIRACDAVTHRPTGEDLANASFLGTSLNTTSNWYYFVLNNEVSLIENTEYCIIGRNINSGVPNYVYWRADTSTGYSGGYSCTSSDSGSTWSVNTANDYMFMIYGEYPAIVVDLDYTEPFLLNNTNNGWVNCTIQDLSGVSRLSSVSIRLTDVGNHNGNITYTYSNSSFTETLDANNIIALGLGEKSNINSTYDLVCFNFRFENLAYVTWVDVRTVCIDSFGVKQQTTDNDILFIEPYSFPLNETVATHSHTLNKVNITDFWPIYYDNLTDIPTEFNASIHSHILSQANITDFMGHTHYRDNITDFWSIPFWSNIPDIPDNVTNPPSSETTQIITPETSQPFTLDNNNLILMMVIFFGAIALLIFMSRRE